MDVPFVLVEQKMNSPILCHVRGKVLFFMRYNLENIIKIDRKEKERKEADMFWDKISEQLIFTGMEAESPDDIFARMGGALIKSGKCRESYTEALKEREKVFPTGIMVQDTGVAIPHTDPEHVVDSAIAIAVLKNPVEFYHMGTNPSEGMKVPVTFVIMLAIAGRQHLEMLQKAIQLIQDQEVLQKLIQSEDAAHMIQIIKEKEEKEHENS